MAFMPFQGAVNGYTGGTELDIRVSDAEFPFDRGTPTGEKFKKKKRASSEFAVPLLTPQNPLCSLTKWRPCRLS